MREREEMILFPCPVAVCIFLITDSYKENHLIKAFHPLVQKNVQVKLQNTEMGGLSPKGACKKYPTIPMDKQDFWENPFIYLFVVCDIPLFSTPGSHQSGLQKKIKRLIRQYYNIQYNTKHLLPLHMAMEDCQQIHGGWRATKGREFQRRGATTQKALPHVCSTTQPP